MTEVAWVPLHVHSQFSVLDALASVQGLAKQAAEFDCPAIALTDHGNMYGAVDFYTACVEAGVKPIIGCEVYVAPGDRREKKKVPGQRVANHLVLLAKNEVGYHNLCKLSSAGFVEGFYYFPRIDKELLAEHSEGLICLSGCMSGRVAQAIADGDENRLQEEIQWHHELFGDDYYLELQRQPMSEEDIEGDGLFEESWLVQQYESFIEKQEKINGRLMAVGKERGIPLVATNDIHYLKRDDWRAHEVLLNVQSGEPCEIWETDASGNRTHRVPNPKRRTYASHELYFKSPQQMAELFEDVPEALSNTVAVADKCTLELDFKAKHYPVFVPPDLEGQKFTKKERKEASEQFLRDLCEKGIARCYTPERLATVQATYPDRDPMEMVRERLEYELGVIIPKGMCDYLLIVWDFIDWAKRNDIPVGPGRGSGAGSIVLFLIGITDIEPLRFKLFFERFINPERLSYPDIDVDICMERRGEVIDYTVRKYGKANVAQIITFGTMKAKMAVRDVGRVLSIPLSQVNQIAKLVPEDLGMTLDKALDLDPDLLNLYQTDEETRRLLDLARRLEGSVRNTGIHAAGVIVAGEPLTEHIPVCTAKDSEMAVTQYSMKPAEKVGMLKIDFLGLTTLTSIRKACEAIPGEIDPLTLPLDDQKTFDLLNRGKTSGVFQMESGGMQELARGLHIDRFEEIIAVGALYRPGPMGMIPSFIARKHGREPIEYDHPEMKAILQETYGIMVYQEHVLQIAQQLAGYTAGEGDILRKAMGKKIRSQMAKQRKKFIAGAIDRGIGEATAEAVFEKMEKFAEYGFNKAHATCYGLLTYITAYLKANYPREWMAALMTCVRHDLSKVANFIREAQSMGIAILPPDVNEAGDSFVATKLGIRFAMSGIKGVGRGVVEAIVEERDANGPFADLYDFCKRIDVKRVGKKAIESLAEAGCFDFTGWSRDQLLLSVEPMYETATRDQRDQAAGVLSLFSLMGEEAGAQFDEPPPVANPSSRNQTLFREKELLGFFLTGHPMDTYKDRLRRLSCAPFSQFDQMADNAVFRTAFIVDEAVTRISARSGKKFAILTISDGLESRELPIWPELYEEKGDLLEENQLLYAVVQIDRREGSTRLSCRWLDDLTRADESMIAACDAAYDKAKTQAARPRRTKPRPQQEKKVVTKRLNLIIDADQVRLSHLVELKEALRRAAGPAPVTLEFRSGERPVGRVHLPEGQGVNPTKQLTDMLANIPHLVLQL